MGRLLISLTIAALCVVPLSGRTFRTTITKWQDGKQAAVAITFDDSTINQFRIALPLLNDRRLPATFFVVTGEIPGSKYPPMFIGRPIMDVLRESATAPTTKDNILERSSVLWYLGTIERVEAAGTGIVNVQRLLQSGDFSPVDSALAALRATGVTYTSGGKPWVPVRSQEAGRPLATVPGGLTWDEFRREAAKGHEFANHAVSHPRLPALDEANILYEVDKARDDIRAQLGDKHTFSIEAPYGIDDERVRKLLIDRFPLTRNWIADTDDFMDGIMRGSSRAPGSSTREYVQWQRGPVTATPIEQMTGWIDTSLAHGTWLVLVIHGIEGVGYQPLPTEKVRAYFDYIKAQEDRLWVATFQDGAKYIRERMRSLVDTKEVGRTIEVRVSHSLDPALYQLPLTARTTVPDEWRSARVVQGKDARTVPVQRGGAESYAQYRVVPNGGVVRLTKAE
jgi:peptidoglycan/xylan/chitin deacetylase (PgdA/CDA1 family)